MFAGRHELVRGKEAAAALSADDEQEEDAQDALQGNQPGNLRLNPLPRVLQYLHRKCNHTNHQPPYHPFLLQSLVEMDRHF